MQDPRLQKELPQLERDMGLQDQVCRFLHIFHRNFGFSTFFAHRILVLGARSKAAQPSAVEGAKFGKQPCQILKSGFEIDGGKY